MVIRASCPVSSCGFREICILGFCTGPWQLLLPCGDTSLLYTGTRSNGGVVLRVVQRVARELRRRVNEGSGTRCRKSRKKKKKENSHKFVHPAHTSTAIRRSCLFPFSCLEFLEILFPRPRAFLVLYPICASSSPVFAPT